LAGITGEERLLGPIRESVIKRLPWLAINVLTLFIAISVIDAFEAVIAGTVALAIFLPIVSGEGGNAGSQTSTVIVRSIALNEIQLCDGRKVLFKEIIVSFINGLIIGLATALVVYLWIGIFSISLAIFLAMTGNFLIAALTGVLIPLGLNKLDIDPALSSAAFVTAFTDAFGFLFFLGIVSLII
jgi:magnesium transporter